MGTIIYMQGRVCITSLCGEMMMAFFGEKHNNSAVNPTFKKSLAEAYSCDFAVTVLFLLQFAVTGFNMLTQGIIVSFIRETRRSRGKVVVTVGKFNAQNVVFGPMSLREKLRHIFGLTGVAKI